MTDPTTLTRRDAEPRMEAQGVIGLSDEEARARLASDGPNELPSNKSRTAFAIALEVAREPMFLLLVTAGSLYLLMGKPEDALMLLGFVFVVMGITVVQERRTERALDALRDLSSPRALVVRSGVQQRIAGRDVVRGDVIVVAEGDRVPADAVLRSSMHLSVDESLLTGESVPVRKLADSGATSLRTPGGDDSFSLFSGTLVTSGQGIAEVIATGVRSELGKIGRSLQKIEPEPTPLQRETGRIVKMLAIVGLCACAIVVVAFAITRGAGTLQFWKEGLLAGITMAMAILPEEFPVVLTVFLALGAWRISRSRVLTRRMPAIETLGAATVLCVDKTGTLTQNQMTVRALATDRASKFLDGSNCNLLPEDQFRELLETAVLASKPEPFDPMERAIHRVFKSTLSAHARHHPDYEMLREYALTPEFLAMTHVWREGESNVVVIASKGAPEAIADLCQLSQEERARVSEIMSSFAAKGLRVLGVASGEGCATDLPENQRGLKLRYVGLVAFEDPLRENVPAAVAECRSAGIRVVMITGDYPQTAQSIATQAGLSNPDAIITGPELGALSDEELTMRIRTAQVFARVVPEQKLRIVNALKANNEVVAMTGDGVNDAPALKAAHIGIAMGGRGTDVAREAASLVLLDDDFSSIVSAVKLGRRIFANIQKAIVFILAVHIPIAGLSMAPIFLTAWPLLLLPIHIVFLELIIDPSCSLIFEAEEAEPDTMQRPPRDRNERLFSQRTVTRALFQGLSVLVACLAVVAIAQPGHGANAARTLSFTTLVVSFVTIILANLSSGRSTFSSLHLANRALWWVLGGTTTLLVLVISVPALRRLFYFDKPHLDDAVLSILAGIGCVLWFDLVSAKRRGKQIAG